MTAALACRTGDVAPGGALRCELPGAVVAVVRDTDGGWHALADRCSHGTVSLSEGHVSGCTVECWGHGSAFDLTTGEPLGLPATNPVAVYTVTIDGDEVYVDMNPATPTSTEET
ncbi:MAG: non-heme iron oxygenase ferredoxin subunit [Micrococcales bacterium]|nr:non-heme iron oxygenase ferredoxin subunit [Micrococcales bacterium]